MFILHSSNKSENLLQHLTTVLRSAPLSSAFSSEVFLIQSQGMERWLAQQLAEQFQVFGNFEFLFPGRFFNTLAEHLDSTLHTQFFDRDVMVWRIEKQLRQLEDDVFLPLQQYLTGANITRKRFQLAQQLAMIFDQYQLMRPDLLDAWQQQKLLYDTAAERWQRALWQNIIAQQDSPHRGILWQQCITKLNQSKSGEFSTQLPQRVTIFGVNTMPPLFLEFLQGLARHCDVHFYLLNPAEQYWADLLSKRQRARIALQSQMGHPLLETLGQQGREFQEMLLQLDFAAQFDSFAANPGNTNLQRLQNDMLQNQLSAQALKADGSIGVHACHTRMREVQVLKDQLLQTLEKNPQIQLRDMVVMAPDIQHYAPYISAVFADLPHAIADRSLRMSNVLLDSFINLLHLSCSRLGWQSVLDLLQQPCIYPSFGLSLTDLERIQHWVEDCHVRWGRNAEHKTELGLPAQPENTWESMLQRLLMGYAIADDSEFVAHILPYADIEGSSAQALGGLYDFLQLLFSTSRLLNQPCSLADWSQRLMQLATQLFGDMEHDYLPEKTQLLSLLQELDYNYSEIHKEDVSVDVIIAWLESSLSEHKSTQGFLRGQLTFCSLLPMRSIPFKVIGLLGMNEGEFPKQNRQATFDLLTQELRLGDRSRRADDRYQFLEVLLSARQQLIITYIGLSISDNQAIPPAVVICELLDVLLGPYQLQDLVQHHPLQAFSSRYFDSNTGFFSYDQGHCATAKALTQDRQPARIWWQGTLPEDAEQSIDLSDFFSFFRHPQKYFLKRQLGLCYLGIGAVAEEREPFQLNSLESYLVYQHWIASELRDEHLSLQKLQALGLWPSGVQGELAYLRDHSQVIEFSARIMQKQIGSLLPAQPVDIMVGDYRLIGKLENCYTHGSLLYRYANLKGSDLLLAWLHHILINTTQEHSTRLLSKDNDLCWTSEQASANALQPWLNIYLQGRLQPDVLFVETAYAYLMQSIKLLNSSRSKTPALETAHSYLFDQIHHGHDKAMQRLFSQLDDVSLLLGAEFEHACQTLWLPLWQGARHEQ